VQSGSGVGMSTSSYQRCDETASPPLSFQDVVAMKEEESMWSLLKHQSEITREIDVIDFIIARYTHVLQTMNNENNSVDALGHLIGLMDFSFAVTGLSFDLKAALKQEIESLVYAKPSEGELPVPGGYLGPFPNKDQVTRFLKEIAASSWWGLADKSELDIRQFHWRWELLHQDNVDSGKIQEFKDTVANDIGRVSALSKTRIKELKDKWKKYPLMDYYCTGIWTAMDRKHFGFLGAQIVTGDDEFAGCKRTPDGCPWLYILDVLRRMSITEFYQRVYFDTVKTSVKFAPRKLTGDTIPRIILHLTHLKSIRKDQKERVHYMQAKVVACFVTVGITLGQCIVHKFMHAFMEDPS